MTVESDTHSGHPPDLMNKLVSFAKRRGFIFKSSEIYGGVGSVYDYGPLGIELKNRIQQLWWREMVYRHDNIVGIDAGILMNPEVWVASGHVGAFSDPLIECRSCHRRFRVEDVPVKTGGEAPRSGSAAPGGVAPDSAARGGAAPSDADGAGTLAKIPEEEEEESLSLARQCPVCGTRGQWTDPRNFNLMFKTFMGVVENEAATVYLRPETAQGIFVNFRNVQDSLRQKIPFGIAQVGKAFRNEITPGNFIFRTREFEQMELQFFVAPESADEWFERWKARRMRWVESLGIRPERLRFHEHGPNEVAHYCKCAYDIQYRFPFGWHEFEGIHNRTDYDLGRHQEHSGKKLEYFDQAANRRYVPYVIETSAGLSRTLLVALADAYDEEDLGGGKKRVVLRLSPALAPVQAAVFPLVKKDGMPEIAEKLASELRGSLNIVYDAAGSIGRRYRRQDEAGTPFCLTVDGQTLSDETVTVRDRDTLVQSRVPLRGAGAYLREAIAASAPGAD